MKISKKPSYFVIYLILLAVFTFASDKVYRLYQQWQTVKTGEYSFNTLMGVRTFFHTFHSWPGDMKDAGKRLKGCAENEEICNPASAWAGDGHIGISPFNQLGALQLADKTVVPAETAGDETQLFWVHMELSGHSVRDIDAAATLNNGTPVKLGVTHPYSFGENGYVAGYIDGSLPEQITPQQDILKSNVIVLVSKAVFDGKAELYEAGEQSFAAWQARSLDLKFDDGRPLTGNLRAYGSPSCFAAPKKGEKNAPRDWRYNTDQTEFGLFGYAPRDCGLIWEIVPPKS